MDGFSDYLARKCLEHTFKIAAFTQASNLYVALSFVDPLPDGSGLVEPSGGGYARVIHNAWAYANRQASNAGSVQLPTATADWGTQNLTYFAVFDALIGGNLYVRGALAPAQRVQAGDAPRFLEGFLRAYLPVAA